MVGIALLVLLLLFGRTKTATTTKADQPIEKTGNQSLASNIAIDSLIGALKNTLPADQRDKLNLLENKVAAGSKQQQIEVYHQLGHFWKDTGHAFIPYAWYTSESARLENSEKSLTFAGHLLLNQLQQEEDSELRKWMALQAKDLLERSLILNPANDSSKVGIGSAYLFGGISSAPMEGIAKIREVIDRDSTNVYAQLTLALGSLMSGQSDKAKERLQVVARIQPDNLQAVLMLADLYEREADKKNAIIWYNKAAGLTKRSDIKAEIEKRIAVLNK